MQQYAPLPKGDAQIALVDTLRDRILSDESLTDEMKEWCDVGCLTRYLEARHWNLYFLVFASDID